MRGFLDVVSAFPSIGVSLTVKLQERDLGTKEFLRSMGFEDGEIDQIFTENLDSPEFVEVGAHLQALIVAFQQDHQIIANLLPLLRVNLHLYCSDCVVSFFTYSRY